MEFINNKSSVIRTGLDTELFAEFSVAKYKSNEITVPTLLFNHREYDKRADLFLKLIDLLDNENVNFKINLTSKIPEDLKRELINMVLI